MIKNPPLDGQRKFRFYQAVGILKERRKDFFWAWIVYQTIKGTATTALLWLPAFAYWFSA